MVFLDSAGPETRKIIAAAHQSEAPQFTAFPLSLLTKDFLHPYYPNPVQLGTAQASGALPVAPVAPVGLEAPK